jgi:hypothetical protein
MFFLPYCATPLHHTQTRKKVCLLRQCRLRWEGFRYHRSKRSGWASPSDSSRLGQLLLCPPLRQRSWAALWLHCFWPCYLANGVTLFSSAFLSPQIATGRAGDCLIKKLGIYGIPIPQPRRSNPLLSKVPMSPSQILLTFQPLFL